MAYSEQNPLDYRSGGDRVKQWGAKYKEEIPHIYNILNSLLKHQAYGDVTVQDEDGAMKVFTLSIEEEDGTVRTERHLAIGIDTGENFQWVDIGQIASRFGAPLTSEALTNDDVAQSTYEPYKLLKTNADGILPTDITGSAGKIVGKVISVNNLSDGQVMVWRAYDQKWHNENKAAVGEGKALELKNGETTVCLFSGESDQAADIGKWNNITLTKTTDNIADIRYVATLETTSAETAKLQKATPEAEGRTFAMRDTDGYLFAVTPATNDSSQKVATTANAAAKVTAHNDDSEAHTAAFASQLATFKLNTLGYRQKNTLYSVGAQANADGLPEGYFLECTAPGTSGSSGIVLPETIVVGATVIDGTVMWKIRKKASTTEVENVKGDITAIQTELVSNNRKPSTTYVEKDIRYYSGLPVGWYFECTTAGITDSGDITLPSPVVENATVTDGTVTWTIRKIGSGGDGVPLGAILPLAHNSTLPSGYLLCDGAAVSRTMFPDLFAAIGTTYGAGDGSTTFNVPDYNSAERFVQGSSTAGIVKQAGLPNITGEISSPSAYWLINTSDGVNISGALVTERVNSGALVAASSSGTLSSKKIAIDASRSSSIYGNSTTVQPNALTSRYIIKAFDGQTADSALIDITQYAQELAGKADRDLDNLSADGENHFLERDFTIIYPNGGTEANPANVTANSRYVEANPFPGYYVNCQVEVYVNSQWGVPGWASNDFTNARGVIAKQGTDGNIIVQSGTDAYVSASYVGGSTFGGGSYSLPLPCRVKVWKIGKIPTE